MTAHAYLCLKGFELSALKFTSDIWFTAFLMKQGHNIAKHDVVARGKVTCYFELSEEKWNDLKLAFAKSEISEYKALIGKVRDLGY